MDEHHPFNVSGYEDNWVIHPDIDTPINDNIQDEVAYGPEDPNCPF